MEEYVVKRLAQGAVVFGFGSYASLKLAHSACPKSLLCMLAVLKLMFSLAPSGTVSYHLLEAMFEMLGKMARFEWHNEAIEGMGWGHVAVSEDCHGPYQKLAQQPRRYEQRTRACQKKRNRH